MEQKSDTLVIKHLPNILNNDEKEDLLKHFGALEVKCVTSKIKKYNIVFARFENEQIAETILHRLHQIHILGSCLSVEFAKDKLESQLPKFKELDITDETQDEKYYKQFIQKLNSWHSSLDFRQSVPNHLRYQYPPPDDLTLLNIVKVLVSVPKFYTQVLHLMNKMNLPCPFGKEILPDIKINLSRPTEINEEIPKVVEAAINQEEEGNETTESEISTDEETGQQKETIPERPKIQKKKRIKVPKFVKPVQVQVTERRKKKKTTFEEVFEKVAGENEPKKIKLSHPQQFDLAGKKDGESSKEVSEVGGFGFIHPVTKPQIVEEKIDVRDEREEERLEKEEIICITKEELAANRLSEKDRSVLTVFKNYAEGAPTCRLYVKNLAKTVTEQDLRFIYSRFLSREVGEDPSLFDIRLMQEGRMKGQAFITLQTVELAQTALKETNGYILKDKALVVQFARSATK